MRQSSISISSNNNNNQRPSLMRKRALSSDGSACGAGTAAGTNAGSNRREMLTTAQSMRCFLETGSVIAPSDDGGGYSLGGSFNTLDAFEFDEQFDEQEDDEGDEDDDEHEESQRDMSNRSKLSKKSEASTTNSMVSSRSKNLFKLGVIESMRVRKWRCVVIVSLVVIGIVVSGTTYASLKQQVNADFEDAFHLFADTMQEAFATHIQQVVAANRGLSRAITTAAINAKATDTFPYFIVPSFEAYAHEARQLSQSDVFMYAPVVAGDDLDQWSRFATETSVQWLTDSKSLYDALEPGLNRSMEPPPMSVSHTIWSIDNDGRLGPWKDDGIFVPSLHTSPPPMSDDVTVHQNINLFSNEMYRATGLASLQFKGLAFTPFQKVNVQFSHSIYHGHHGSSGVDDNDHDSHDEDDEYHDFHPNSVAAQPVYRYLNETEPVGFLYSIVAWKNFLTKLLPSGAADMEVVLQNACHQEVTYTLHGGDQGAIYKGEGDLHNRAYRTFQRTIDFADVYEYHDDATSVMNLNNDTTVLVDGHCPVTLKIYPTKAFEVYYSSILPEVLAGLVAVLFFVMAVVFAIYDRVQYFLNTAVVDSATRSNAIVASLFPSNVRDRLLAEATTSTQYQSPHSPLKTSHNRLGSMRQHVPGDDGYDGSDNLDPNGGGPISNKPIADLFPATTVLFADIVGFTAWSSTRDPGQVFTLLETVYQAFDEIASKRGIFKVETIGDCYVAVCGLPDPTNDHAVSMARFARKILVKMWSLVKKLESSLGPDTTDLTLRIGMHSGPVTAGVLRGERSRFQLFGDTVNTASRMESTGKPNRIQLSQETAALLEAAGKSTWFKKRADNIHAKGKGLLQTYFLEFHDGADMGAAEHTSREEAACDDSVFDPDSADNQQLVAKNARLVAWNTNVLFKLLKQIAAQRAAAATAAANSDPNSIPPVGAANERLVARHGDQTVLDEVKEIIALPGFDSSKQDQTLEDAYVDPKVGRQLHSYLTTIASMYQNNPFHNFDHATHVAMSVVKLLSRIIAPTVTDLKYTTEAALIRGDHTYGITSDPLTQFSCVLSALIHDVDHSGVPNAVLVKEQSYLATRYNGKSIAEQNSVDLAWDILMEDRFRLLRQAIYSNDVELRRFRQLIVNSVMATDIVDAQQKEFRNARWDRAFHGSKPSTVSPIDVEQAPRESDFVATNRKATIVIEHLIQASDVSHTMQHWHIYRKWNERFFKECYQAYKVGRTDVDPSIGWYQGEIGFFDYYIIPLAKKLKDCGVFGVSSDEYLTYAQKNRAEWESRGKDIVAKMIEKYRYLEYGDDGDDEMCEVQIVETAMPKLSSVVTTGPSMRPTTIEVVRERVSPSVTSRTEASSPFDESPSPPPTLQALVRETEEMTMPEASQTAPKLASTMEPFPMRPSRCGPGRKYFM